MYIYIYIYRVNTKTLLEGQTVTGRSYLEMLTNWLLAQLAAEETWLRLSARWGAAALASRCPHVPQRALAKQMDWPRWTKWPNVLQVAPEIAGPDRLWLSSFWRYVKDRVYVPPLPATAGDLQERITAAVNSVTPDMLQRVRSELDYCIDICRVTREEGRGGAHWVRAVPHETVWVYATVATNFVRIFQ